MRRTATCEVFEISDDGTERVAVVRIAMQHLGMQDELSAFGRGGWRGNRHLAAKLVRRPCLAAALPLRCPRIRLEERGGPFHIRGPVQTPSLAEPGAFGISAIISPKRRSAPKEPHDMGMAGRAPD
jgi:hypothetical protein